MSIEAIFSNQVVHCTVHSELDPEASGQFESDALVAFNFEKDCLIVRIKSLHLNCFRDLISGLLMMETGDCLHLLLTKRVKLFGGLSISALQRALTNTHH